jgi:hypothetical protein
MHHQSKFSDEDEDDDEDDVRIMKKLRERLDL